jgi:hypothetical protein
MSSGIAPSSQGAKLGFRGSGTPVDNTASRHYLWDGSLN